ncbi:hypothetical protein [Helicobacter mesocricetorum]|uniref:hypothetical protein n=1 Tax=Helicobacter mesocricetorum TaxID=87012 RepID=UPI000CF02AAD|nr:hypothetical protein [Helicobacter mesocricetorum]
MDAKIKDFVSNHHLLALSVLDNQQEIYTASCYYAFNEERLSLIFKSSQDCKHIQLAKSHPKVGVIIAEDSKNLRLIKGLQIKALFRDAQKSEVTLYYKNFPYALLAGGGVFGLDILWAKYTDNTLLLEDKLTYTRN